MLDLISSHHRALLVIFLKQICWCSCIVACKKNIIWCKCRFLEINHLKMLASILHSKTENTNWYSHDKNTRSLSKHGWLDQHTQWFSLPQSAPYILYFRASKIWGDVSELKLICSCRIKEIYWLALFLLFNLDCETKPEIFRQRWAECGCRKWVWVRGARQWELETNRKSVTRITRQKKCVSRLTMWPASTPPPPSVGSIRTGIMARDWVALWMPFQHSHNPSNHLPAGHSAFYFFM